VAVKRKYHVILEPAEEGGFGVYVPELPGCFSQGETEEDALDNIKDAIGMWLDDQESEIKNEVESHREWVRTVELIR